MGARCRDVGRDPAGDGAAVHRGAPRLTGVPAKADGSSMRTSRARALGAAALVATCGCSLVSVRRPPPPPLVPDAPLECTQSRVAPVLDTVGAIAVPLVGLGLWLVCTYTASMQSWSSDPVNLQCGSLLWGTALSTAAYTGSAVYGYQATGSCRRLAAQRRAGAPESGTPP